MWKKKAGERLAKRPSRNFDNDFVDSSDQPLSLALAETAEPIVKRAKFPSLEDSFSKAKRLKSEGTTLAEAERYWEAIKRFDGAVHLTPNDATIHEMKAQIYMQLQEVWPAVSSADEAVRLDPLWYIGHQTLGRARLGVGDVPQAVTSFMKAVHLNPTNVEMIVDDLMWAKSLDDQRKAATSKNVKEAETAKQETSTIVITDYYSEDESPETEGKSSMPVLEDASVRTVTTETRMEAAKGSIVCSCAGMKDMVKMNLKQ